MRKARALLMLLLLACPALAQRGGEPELMPGFKPLPRKKTAPKAVPLKDLAVPEETGYDILPARKPEPAPYDLMRKPSTKTIGAKAERRPVFSARARAWFYKGSVDTRFSEQVPPEDVTPPGTEVWLGETEERGAKGFMLVYGAELAPLPWLSVSGEYGRDTGSKSTGRERFWVHSPQSDSLTYFPTGATWSRPRYEDDLVYTQSVRGQVEWAAANLYLRVIEARIAGQDDDEFRHAFDVGAGYHRLRVNQKLSGRGLSYTGGRFYSSASRAAAPGEYASYDALWQGAHAAIRDVVRFPRGFHAEGEALWAPVGMEFRGDGHDRTIAGLQAASPNITDRARGSAIHFRFSGGWNWGPFALEGGYQRLYFYSRTGRRRFNEAGGAFTDYDLNFGTTELAGLFAGASVRF
jgi:hypothetical protein